MILASLRHVVYDQNIKTEMTEVYMLLNRADFFFFFFSFPMNHLIYRCSKVVTTASLHAAYYQMLVVSSPQSFLCLFLIIMHSQCTKTRPTNDQPDVFVSEHFACNCCSRRAIKCSFSWGFPQLFSFKTLMF